MGLTSLRRAYKVIFTLKVFFVCSYKYENKLNYHDYSTSNNVESAFTVINLDLSLINKIIYFSPQFNCKRINKKIGDWTFNCL